MAIGSVFVVSKEEKMFNRQVLLKARPHGMPTVDDFDLVETALPAPARGEILVRNTMLSLDPYMRGRMDAGKSYAPRVELGDVMTGHTVGEVVESRSPDHAVEDKVWLTGNWQEYAVAEAARTRKIDSRLPDEAWLGPMGLPGWTAHYGLFELGTPKRGETLVVSSAAGAVGGLVGQLAKSEGLRTVGIAGGAEKCKHVLEELGFDACVDYRAGDFTEQLADACPDGIDVDFENAGGDVLNAVWPLLNAHARVVVCGLTAQYNLTDPYPGPNMMVLLKQRIRVQGFVVGNHPEHIPVAIDDMVNRLLQKRITWHADISEGLENAPSTFIGMLNGRNLGKTLVKLS
jgi:NADPH-dependent curcumin reductase CurA